MLKLPKIAVKTKYTPFEGGLDTETPAMVVQPGKVKTSQNVYQGVQGGYIMLEGNERFDGRPKPSAAIYSILPVTLSGSVSVGDVVTDNTAAASGTVIVNATTYLVLTKVTGAFAVGNIKIGAAVVGTCSAAQSAGSASTKRLDAQYTNLAADLYRADITAIPGSGEVLGVWWYKNVCYGFRNNAGATAVDMYKSTASGWSQVALGNELNFTSGGTYVPVEGDTITGEISGATAVLTRVVLQSGSFAAGDAVGKFIFASKTGNFQAETVKVGATLNIATIAGNSSAITFSNINGSFEFVNANFTGSQDTVRMYGVDGKNRGFEFDGTVFVPIETGMATYPTHVIEHKYHLFYSFLGSAQHSSPGFPYIWDIVTGADELGMSDHITSFVAMPGGEGAAVLAIISRNSIAMLYGSSSADWHLVPYRNGTGAITGSAQLIGNTFMLDDRGITQLSTSQTYGNFSDAAISGHIQSWLRTKKVQVSASCVSMDRSLYCLFFNDKSALFCTVNGGKIKAMMPIQMNHKVCCVCSAEENDGTEVIVFGDENGFVHQMFKGTSFDGADKEWFLELVYDHLNSPTVNKRMRKSTIEVSGDGYAEFSYSYSLGYGDTDIAQPSGQNAEVIMASGTWDVGIWDVGTWDGRNLYPFSFDMSGSAINISHRFIGSSDFHASLKFSGILLQYTPTKETR